MNYSEAVNEAVNNQQFDVALDIYSEWFLNAPEFFQQVKVQGSTATHYQNAASLARKALYDRVHQQTSVSTRLKKAVDFFFGLVSKQFQHQLQHPSFFYVPDLKAQPFYTLAEIPALSELVSQINAFKPELLTLGQQSYQYYVDSSGPVPNTNSWQEVKHKWFSTHLLRGDERTEYVTGKLAECVDLLAHELIAHCPPHAAEAFVSSLLPGAEIPPHFGISNIKLTVHVPLEVNSACWLKAGEETFHWSADAAVMIFDDSFLHSAANHSEQRRDVLIFDIWHPDLTLSERQAIAHFMSQHQLWVEKYGKLAALDAQI
uniref:aspartyl/asparaginyl beta-hydroxylase domain-containing protein n=1 Tax=Rheinheimera sp. TaxID=1869214 RepID=UPI0040488DF6